MSDQLTKDDLHEVQHTVLVAAENGHLVPDLAELLMTELRAIKRQASSCTSQSAPAEAG
jgi:hypothetical protein